MESSTKSENDCCDSGVLRYIHVVNEENHWSFAKIQSFPEKPLLTELGSFDQLQRKLLDELENKSYITSLKIQQTNPSRVLKLSESNQKLMKVETLAVDGDEQAMQNVIEQIDPSYLKVLKLRSEFPVSGSIYNMPQVIHVNTLHVGKNLMSDDQLLQLQCSKLRMKLSENLTTSGIKNFIKKCIQTLDEEKLRNFRIEFDGEKCKIEEILEGFDFLRKETISGHEEIDIPSVSKKFLLEIEYGKNHIEAKRILEENKKMEKPVLAKPVYIPPEEFVVDRVKVLHGHKLSIYIADGNQSIEYECGTPNELARKLQTLQITRFKELMIDFSESLWYLQSGRRLIVDRLILHCEKNCFDYLSQVDWNHLKELMCFGRYDSRFARLFSLPHVVNAEKLELSYCCIKDYQLVKLKAVHLVLHSEPYDELTCDGINEFIKIRLRSLNTHDYFFRIFWKEIDPFLDGLDIFSDTQTPYHSRVVIVNSPYPEYQLKLSICETCVEGERITKNSESED